MASSKFAESWTVVIVMDEDANLTGTFQVLPSTRLSRMMQMWKDAFDLFGNWVFVSANNDVTFHDDGITLERVGETAPRLVYLRTQLFETPTSEIFVHLKDKCHHLVVDSNETLGEALERLPGKPKFLEYNGSPINLNHTVRQAGLPNNSVIYEPLCSITVKLSSKDGISLQMPSNSLVHHLKEEVKFYESEDFSLVHQGRHLNPDEPVAQLKHVVEVSTTEFVVDFNDRRISWIARSEPISLPEFRTQLSVEGDIDAQTLETVEFACVGCQRRIFQSEDYVQRLPAECCIEKSLTLRAICPPHTGSTSESNDLAELIRSICNDLVQCRKADSRTERSRRVSRRLEETSAGEKLDYNTIIQCSETLLRSADELEDKIKELQDEIKELTTKNEGLEEERRQRSPSLPRIDETDAVKIDKKTTSLKSVIKRDDRKTAIFQRSKSLDSTGFGLFNAAREQHEAKLLLFFKQSDFTAKSSSKVEDQGLYLWSRLHHIKCSISKIRAGPITFKALRAVLKPLFTGQDIRLIRQCHGSVAGKEVSEATSRDDDEAARPDKSPYMNNSPYCDDKGSQYSWEEAGKPGLLSIRKGDQAFLCGGGRRTVLTIDWK